MTGTRTIVFLHDRGEEFRDPSEIESDWLAALASGLVRGGLPVVSNNRVVVPFYANVLYSVIAGLGQRGSGSEVEHLPVNLDVPGPLHPYMPRQVGLLERMLLSDMASVAGMPLGQGGELEAVVSWALARGALRWLVGWSHEGPPAIGVHVRDMAVYLSAGRRRILAAVRKGIPARTKLVLVSHGLGSMVACDLLADVTVRQRAVLWVTLGSPLGLPSVQRNLLTKGPVDPNISWLNAYASTDVIALGAPLHLSWGGGVNDVKVDNGDQPHAAARYLSHPVVARSVMLGRSP